MARAAMDRHWAESSCWSAAGDFDRFRLTNSALRCELAPGSVARKVAELQTCSSMDRWLRRRWAVEKATTADRATTANKLSVSGKALSSLIQCTVEPCLKRSQRPAP